MLLDMFVILFILAIIILFFVNPVFQTIVIYFFWFVVLIIFLILFFRFFVKKYDEYQRAIIFRFGKFHRVAGPGWAIVLPFFEKEFAKVDVRTHMLNFEIDTAFTSDDLRLSITGTTYYQVSNPNKAVLQIDNYLIALKNLIVSETRNVIGSMNMRELFSKLEKLNDLVADAVRHEVWKWGIDISTMQVRDVRPPAEIAIAMQQKEIEAQQLQAKRFEAEARKVMIEAIGSAANNLSDKAVMYFYIKALEELGKGQATKIIFPTQFFDVLQGMDGEVKNSMVGAGLANVGIDTIVDSVKNKIVGP
jgi:regulator of protease activity HflC (stomatin/prohibitin superfamily)